MENKGIVHTLDGATVSNKSWEDVLLQAMTAACIICKLGEKLAPFVLNTETLQAVLLQANHSSSQAIYMQLATHNKKSYQFFSNCQQSAVVDVPFEPAKRSWTTSNSFTKPMNVHVIVT